MLHKLSMGIVAASVALVVGGTAAQASSVQIDWYSVTPGFPDFNLPDCGTQNCGQNFNNEVASTLSGGLPVVSGANPANLAEGAGNVLQWWTPQTGVVHEGTTVQNLPINQNMFVPEGTGSNDTNAFQTAIITGILHVTTTATIKFGGDDDMFLALNGNVVDQVGGIHPQGVTGTDIIGPGNYLMQVFYADRHVVGASAFLDVTGGSLTAPVPEPSTWAMMILGFCGVGFLAYRRKSKVTLRLA